MKSKTADKPWYAPRTSDEITPYPWLHPDAIEYLESLLRPDWDVLEHGSGGSTLWFATRARQVISIEHNPAWREKVRSLAPANVSILERFVEVPTVFVGKFDLFLIDGEREKRGACLLGARKIVKPGGWVVLDNANRPEYRDERLKFSDHATLMSSFDNNISTSLYFVTEFWQCASA